MSRIAFDNCVAFIHDLAAEALSCDYVVRLRVIRDAAEEARRDADDAVNRIYHAEGREAGRACVATLKGSVAESLLQIRARLRWAEDPAGEGARLEQCTRELAAQTTAIRGCEVTRKKLPVERQVEQLVDQNHDIMNRLGILAQADGIGAHYQTHSQSIAAELTRVTIERDMAFAALRLAEPALRTLRDGHCDCSDCCYTRALDAVVAALRGAK